MNFSLTEEQTLLRDSARRFVDNEYGFAQRRKRIEEGGFSRENWDRLAAMGWLGISLAEEVGGFGATPVETALVLEQLGRGLVIEPMVPVIMAAQAIELAANQIQRRALLPALVAGESLIVPAHGEAQANGCLARVGTTAVAVKGHYLLSGRKSLVLGGPVADRYLLSARISGDPDDEIGISLFIVDRNAKGVRRQDYRLIDGSPACDLSLEGAEGELIGEQGRAFAALDLAVSHAIVGLGAETVGIMEQVIWTTRDYLQTRRQFGAAIGSFQALQHRMADMVIELEQSRALLHRALAYLPATPVARRHAVSALKAQIGRAGRFVGAQGIQLHGGIGMTEECMVGHYFKRLVVIDGLFGNAQFHLREMAGSYRGTA